MSTLPTGVGFAVVAAILVTAIATATALIINVQRSGAIEAYATAIDNLGGGMARQTEQSIARIDDLIREISASAFRPPSVAPNLSGLAMRATSLTLNSAGAPQVADIVLIDPRGILANDLTGSQAAADEGERELVTYFSTHHDNSAYVSRAYQAGPNGAWQAVMGRRLEAADGQFVGVAAAVLPLDEWSAFYKVAMPPNRSVTLARGDGAVLLQYPPVVGSSGGTFVGTEVWNAVVAKGGGPVQADDNQGSTPIIASVNPLAGLPFVITATVPQSLALSDWSGQRPWIELGGVVATASALFLIYVFAGQYSRIKLSEASLSEKNQQLVLAHGQLDATLSNISQGVCFFDGDRKLVVANRRYSEIYDLPTDLARPGVTLAEIVAARLAVGSGGNGGPDEYAKLVDTLICRTEPSEIAVALENGRTILVRQQPLPEGGWVATHEDITEQRKADAEIAYLATHDILTGVANRALLRERMEQARVATENGQPYAVLFIDLDGFKAVNSTLGHQGGDELLRAVAKRLVASVREADTVARTGGDEFVIMLQDLVPDLDVTGLASRIIETVSVPFKIAGRDISVGASIGIAIAPRDGKTVEAVVNCADMALYAAKAEGRGRLRFFEANMQRGLRNYA
jgi:diguanylate cyclase (GGDEF)-like protein